MYKKKILIFCERLNEVEKQECAWLIARLFFIGQIFSRILISSFSYHFLNTSLPRKLLCSTLALSCLCNTTCINWTILVGEIKLCNKAHIQYFNQNSYISIFLSYISESNPLKTYIVWKFTLINCLSLFMVEERWLANILPYCHLVK